MSLFENFIESIAQVLSRALTDDETEKLLSSFHALQQRLRQLSVDNLKRLEVQEKHKRILCKHKNSCFTNSVRAWVRSFLITYVLKYGLNFVPALLMGKIWKRPNLLFKIGGKDTISFAFFMSTFISSYKAMLCTMRYLRPINDPLNAFIAGSVAGLSLLLDKNRSRRIMISLYLMTRTGHFLSRFVWRSILGPRVNDPSMLNRSSPLSPSLPPSKLRASREVNGTHPTAPVRTPAPSNGDLIITSPMNVEPTQEPDMEDVDDKHHTHHPIRRIIRQVSAVLVMMFSSSQILYAYVCEPDTLAKPYLSFLITHGGIRALAPKKPRAYLDMMGETIHASCSSVDSSISKLLPDRTGSFITSVPDGLPLERISQFSDTLSQAPHDFILCAMQHPSTSSCTRGAINAFIGEWSRAFGMYAPLNAIMTVIFRGKKIIQSPVQSIKSYIKSTLRSVLFLTCYVTTAWSTPCLFRRLRGKEERWMYYVNGILAGACVLIEVPGRRLELGLYCLPRAIESLWNSLVHHGYAKVLPLGEVWYFTVSTGILMSLYQHDPGSIHEGYRKIMYRFFGVN